MNVNNPKTTVETTVESTPKQQPLYKKLLGLGILVAVAVCWFPELQEKLNETMEFVKYAWKEWHNGK